MSSQHPDYQQHNRSFDHNSKLHRGIYAPSPASESRNPYDVNRHSVPIPHWNFQDNTLPNMNSAQGHADVHMAIETCDSSNLTSFHQIHADNHEFQGASASWNSTPMAHTPFSTHTRASSPFSEMDSYPTLSETNLTNALFEFEDMSQHLDYEKDKGQTDECQTWTADTNPALTTIPDGTYLTPSVLRSQALQPLSPTAGHNSVPSPHPVPNRYRKPPKANSELWTREMDSLLLMLKAKGTPHQEISAELLDKFGIDRNPNVVAKRIRKLQDDAVDPEVSTLAR